MEIDTIQIKPVEKWTFLQSKDIIGSFYPNEMEQK